MSGWMVVCDGSRARAAGLWVVWMVVSCALSACGDSDTSSSAGSDTAIDLSDIPVSPPIDTLPEGTTALVGRVLDYTNDAPIVDAVVSSTPPTELVRTNSRGEYVLMAGLVDRQVYTIGATEPRYRSETIEVRAVSEVIRDVDMFLFPDGVASLLTPSPGSVELSANQRRAVVFLVNPSNNAVGIGPCANAATDHTAPPWLKVNVPNGLFYNNKPGAVELLVDAAEFKLASESPNPDGLVEGVVNMCDDDKKPIQITARVQRYDDNRLDVCVMEGAACEDNTSTDRIVILPTSIEPPSAPGERERQRFAIDLQPQHDGAPILGEAVDCTIGEGDTSLPATVTTTSVSDNTGVARCEVELSVEPAPAGTTVRGRAQLSAYDEVAVDFELLVSP